MENFLVKWIAKWWMTDGRKFATEWNPFAFVSNERRKKDRIAKKKIDEVIKVYVDWTTSEKQVTA